MPVAGYSIALEALVATIRKWGMVRNQVFNAADLGDPAVQALRTSVPFYLASEIQDMLSAVSGPEMDDLVLLRHMVPYPNGFLYLPHPVSFNATGGVIRAVSWVCAYFSVSPPSVRIRQAGADVPPFDYLQCYLYASAGAGLLVPMYSSSWLFGHTHTSSREQTRDRSVAFDDLEDRAAESCLRLVMAMFAFVGQRILSTEPASVDRATRRRLDLAHAPESPTVRVVQLRRRASTPSHNSLEDVEWHSRWIVQGHWRRQWYPRMGLHQMIWIMPYVKGPDDKPLRPSRATVYAVVR